MLNIATDLPKKEPTMMEIGCLHRCAPSFRYHCSKTQYYIVCRMSPVLEKDLIKNQFGELQVKRCII